MPLEYRNETWHTEGSEYIGLDVARSGRIIGWRLETDNFGSQRSRYLVKYTEDDFRDFIKNVEMMLTQESYLLLEQRRLEQRRLEPEEFTLRAEALRAEALRTGGRRGSQR